MAEPTVTYDWFSNSEAKTDALGRELADGYLQAAAESPLPLIVALRGELGAGKTRFSKSVAFGCGILSVRSPTFTICQSYRMRSPQAAASGLILHHLDTYRIEDPSELLLQGWDEMCEAGLTLVEWADRIESLLPEKRIDLNWQHVSEQQRQIRASAFGQREVALLQKLNKFAAM